MRALGQHRYYLKYRAVPKSESQPTKRIIGQTELHSEVPPRAFVFTYEQRGWQTLSGLLESLREAARDLPIHIHGLAVLDSDWYVTQEAYADDPPKFHAVEGDALLNFVNGMLHSIGSIEMMQMSIDRYYRDSA